jgi:hypothetical protein
MAFILTAQRDNDVVLAFKRYRAYLEQAYKGFPVSAYELATSEWYFDFTNHKCPHDAWLKEVVISESPMNTDHKRRKVSLKIQLLGAYHDGVIEFFYPMVYSYQLFAYDSRPGHCDWQYDEFRVSDSGSLIHEIEWAGRKNIGRWLIEANDVHYNWLSL